MVKKIVRQYDNMELVPTTATFPPEGSYMSVVVDAYTTEIIPVGSGKEFVHVIDYKLINLNNYQQYSFCETISPYKNTPRTEAFIKTLNMYGFDFFPDDDIIGLVEKIEIVYDFVNGCVAPIIAERKRLSVKEDKDGLRDEDLPF